jgi:hypothetical protein
MSAKTRSEKAIHAQKLSEFYYRMARISDGARSVSYQDRASHWAHVGRSNLFRLIAPKVPASFALQRLTDALVEDILSLSDEEVLQECRDQGLDPDEEAAKMRALFEQAVVEADRRRAARKREAAI